MSVNLPGPDPPALPDRTCTWCTATGPAALFCRYGRTLPLIFVCRHPPGCLDHRQQQPARAAA